MFKKHLRRDQHGFSPGQLVAVIIGVLIVVIVGFALSATLLNSVKTVNQTKDYGVGSPIPGLVNLTPLFWFLGLVIASLVIVFIALRAGMGGS